MEDLKTLIKKVLADNFMLYFKAHSYHWNVEGMFFPMFHDYFGKFYEEIFAEVDVIAEHIRIMGEYAPTKLNDMIEFSSIKEDSEMPADTKRMVEQLYNDNNMLLISLHKAYEEAEKTSELGLADYLQSRIDVHNKHAWILRTIIK